MLKAIFNWFRQPAPEALAPAVQPEAAPYKVEAAPQVVPTLAPVAEVTPTAKPVPAKAKAKPATKKPAAITAAKKPATKASAKKPATKKPA